ncbi:granzyme B(G,H)-like [Bombyx mandarina]|uniref:Granzyme B(G,H)-like n=1 Tax=Bombyx mandarina TaxID=7092 RepID=A0A6J2JSC8_BOMMA|nr:granzyme B(G,H)-like [Bombyx mandarina]
MIKFLNLCLSILLLNYVTLYISSAKTIEIPQTRRILRGSQVTDTRPYMVYLRPAPSSDPQTDPNWLCGGVIIHERFILTSAACIEDVQQFYVVSGIHTLVPFSDNTNECIKNGAKKAVWKCVPKDYFFDGKDFDNMRWMANDIAVVKVEDDFNFQKRVKGCDYVPKMIAYNNQSEELEKPGTVASIAGWGSTQKFSDGRAIGRTNTNSPSLLETDVVLISKKNCKKRWDPRYHNVIEEHMICAKDSLDSEAMSNICAEHHVNCKELVYSDEEEEEENESPSRRLMADADQLEVHTAAHYNGTRRSKTISGGFCENDHGGPLVVGQGKTSVVIGVISACMTKYLTNTCYGPFLYTSVWRYRHLIECSINKEIGSTCRRLLKSTNTKMVETKFEWKPENGQFRSNESQVVQPKSDSIVRLKSAGKKSKSKRNREKILSL